MGFSHSWIAVRGLAPEKALEALSLTELEVVDPREIPDWNDIIVMGKFKDDWLFVLSADAKDAFKGKLARLSSYGPAIACCVDENVMYSEARGYAGGQEEWRVIHDPDQAESTYALDITGNPPPQLDAIVNAARAEQDAEGGEDAGVDVFFDIPGALSKEICGYMPGEAEPDGFRYSVLQRKQPATPGKPGFFARLFGRG